MAAPVPGSANEFIEQQLNKRIRRLEDHFDADALSFAGPLYQGVDRLVRIAVERLKTDPSSRRRRLVVILTTTGGYIEVVHRMVETIRTHYKIVEFVIPDYAYSAGTVFAMSGDNIHMDYYSRLGPIDPQVESPDGKRLVPALGYLVQYKRLLKRARGGKITAAEVRLLIDGFDQAELYQYEQHRKLSIKLLKQWLAKYKFKEWKKTETHHIKVTRQMRLDRAKEIAEELNKIEKWHVHGYGISMDVLRKDLKLRIDDFAENPDLADKIRGYYDLLRDYMAKMSCGGVIHTRVAYEPFMKA